MRIITTLAVFALSIAGTDLIAAQPFSEEDLKVKNLAQLEERARTPQDWQTLAQMWESREAMLLEKAERHDRLEQRYASAPKSLIAKRGHAWNTPKRQAQLAEKARAEAELASDRAAEFIARVGAAAVNVD
jgi:hypothetical protein